ncbi:MAG: Ni/Fe hydrogenase subunit alpha [Candidatus Zixiibacteriota bacterium]|nr:MAG: Ni/Fe hydrogenase subunit alpha [candidate division Zixibacteria bacterium]
MTQTIKIDHLARVEGHGGITVNLEGNAVKEVRFDIYEGARLIEALVVGRSWEDVPQIVSRICAICSAAHNLTAIKAIEDAFGVQVTPQTRALRDLLYRGESIESHALHVFLLAAPDYLGYPSAIALAADKPEAVKLGLRLKKLGNTIQEVIGGRAVHPVNSVVGGFGATPTFEQLFALRRDLQQGLSDCEAMVEVLATLPPADFCHTPTVFAALDTAGDYGYYEGNTLRLTTGKSLAASKYRKLTNEMAVPHSHAKHSHYDHKPFMVGSLARVMLFGEKLTEKAQAAARKLGLTLPSDNPMDNNKAQAVELLFDVEYALETVEGMLREKVKPETPVEIKPKAGTGTAATEAPRGTLFHSYTFDKQGKVTAADVITPTAQNLACCEYHFRAAVDQDPEKNPAVLAKHLEMIARAYDPCISCSVHLVVSR